MCTKDGSFSVQTAKGIWIYVNGDIRVIYKDGSSEGIGSCFYNAKSLSSSETIKKTISTRDNGSKVCYRYIQEISEDENESPTDYIIPVAFTRRGNGYIYYNYDICGTRWNTPAINGSTVDMFHWIGGDPNAVVSFPTGGSYPSPPYMKTVSSTSNHFDIGVTTTNGGSWAGGGTGIELYVSSSPDMKCQVEKQVYPFEFKVNILNVPLDPY